MNQLSLPNKLRISALASATISLTVFFFLPFQVFLPNLFEFTFSNGEIATLLGIVSFVASIALFLFLSFLPSSICRVSIVVLLALSAAIWIQSNILNWEYGQFAGHQIDWHQNAGLGMIDVLIWASVICLSIRFRSLVSKRASGICLYLLVLQLCSLSFAGWKSETEPSFKKYQLSDEGKFEFSPEKNIVFIILDSFQSDIFGEIVDNNSEIKKSLDGFIYFRNAVSAFPYTYLSVPSMLTGKEYDNSIPIQRFISDAFLSSTSVPKKLKEQGFDVRLYSEMPNVLAIEQSSADNVIPKDGLLQTAREREDFVSLISIGLFRAAPHMLKQNVFESRNFGPVNRDLDFAAKIKPLLTHGSEKPTFRFYHLFGVHAPLVYNEQLEFERLNTLSRQDYIKQAKGALSIIDRFIQSLKAAGIYDNTLLIVVGDHGAGWSEEFSKVQVPLEMQSPLDDFSVVSQPDVVARGIPLVMVKPFHSKQFFHSSDNPISLTDLAQTVLSEAGVSNLSGSSILKESFPADRVRHHKNYSWSEQGWRWDTEYLPPLTEYAVSGFSWKKGSWLPTHTVFYPERRENSAPPVLQSGQIVNFSNDEKAKPYLGQGWGSGEPGHIWTEGNYTSLLLPIRTSPQKIALTLDLIPFLVPGKVDVQRIVIYFKGQKLNEWQVTAGGKFEVTIELPSTKEDSTKEEALRIDFLIPDAKSPKELGTGEDIRKLGVAVKSMSIEAHG